MAKIIEVVYENGVLKPLSPLPFREHEKIRITIEEEGMSVKASKGMFVGLNDNIIDEIALSPDYLPEEA